MSTGHLEVEDKYDVEAELALTGLDRLPGVALVAAPVEQELEATYFDTPRLALAGFGVSLRRRTGGEDAGWHLKLPVENGRQELHEPLDGTDDVPASFVDVVAGLCGDEPLQPVG